MTDSTENRGTKTPCQPQQHKQQREAGAMLIIALAVLTLLSILAVTFAALMRLERRATTNFSNNARAEMVASSAESTLVSMLRGGLYWNGYTDPREQYSPWLYLDDRSNLGIGNRMPLDRLPPEQASLAAQMGSMQAGELASGYFKAKVIDTSSQLNLNGQQDSLAEMIDNLGQAIKSHGGYGNHNPLHAGPKETGRLIRGADIITYRNTLEGSKFRSKAELKKFIGSANYDLIADFVTTHSWVDPTTYRATDARPRYNVNLAQKVAPSITEPFVGANSDITGSARLTPEPRSPININTASEPVLVAALTGLSGRRAFPLSLIQTKSVDVDVNALVEADEDDGPRPGQEETSLKPTPVWIYTQPIPIDSARRIAKEIISRRKATPFTVWRSGLKSNPGFEEFINGLPDSMFPASSTIAVANPLGRAGNPGSTIRAKLIAGGAATTSMRSRASTSVAVTRRSHFDETKGSSHRGATPGTRS